MKIALVHEFLTQFGGAERVLQAVHEMYPQAPIFVLVKSDDIVKKYFPNADVKASFLQNLPGNPEAYKAYLPLMPKAVESFNFTGCDFVLSDSSAFAKGAVTNPPTKHISYVHTPTRYLWGETDFYLKTNVPRYLRPIIKACLPALRRWDYQAAQRPTIVIANSSEVKTRIKKYYHRESTVIHPFVDDSFFSIINYQLPIRGYYLMGGRFVLYKRYDIAIEAFKQNRKKLIITGSGVGEQTLSRQAQGAPNITFLGRVSDEKLKLLYGQARAYIFPGLEDFGITPLEAQACGTPVICYGKGGALETVIDGKTGIYFDKQTPDAINEALERFERLPRFHRKVLRRHALQFTKKQFKIKLKGVLNGIARLS